MVVETYKNGEMEVRVHDDAYLGKTKEELEQIKKNLSEIGYRALRAKAEKEGKTA